MMFLGKQVLEGTYVKLLVVLEKISTEMRLDYLSNLSLRSGKSMKSFATSIVS